MNDSPMNVDVRKSLIYLISICFMLGLVAALWATEGFKDFAARRSAWGIPVFAVALWPLLLTNKLSVRLQTKSGLELWARGASAGSRLVTRFRDCRLEKWRPGKKIQRIESGFWALEPIFDRNFGL
jgi:hypothetical protein